MKNKSLIKKSVISFILLTAIGAGSSEPVIKMYMDESVAIASDMNRREYYGYSFTIEGGNELIDGETRALEYRVSYRDTGIGGISTVISSGYNPYFYNVETSDSNVAVINRGGDVVAVGVGTATITSTIRETPSVKRSIDIVVRGVEAQHLELNKYKLDIELGKNSKLEARVYPEKAINKELEWSSSDEKVVKVDGFGNLDAIGLGEAKVTAKVKGTDIKAISTVTVKEGAKSLSLNSPKLEIKKGEKGSLIATVAPENAINKELEWSSSDEKVVKVDSFGNLDAIGAGKATVTAKVKGTAIKAVSEVEVKAIAESVELNSPNLEIKKGEKGSLIATVAPENAVNKELEWSSSDEKVVKVDSSGNLEAIGVGEAIISVKIKGTDIVATTKVIVELTDTGHKFTDIDKHWAKIFIEDATARGLFYGTTDTEFSPDMSMTRGMFVTVLGRLAEEKAQPNGKFRDVNSKVYYAEYIAWAEEKGIVAGYGNGEFRPDSNVSREEMAAIIERYMKYKGVELEVNDVPEFNDMASVSDWAKESVRAIQKAGIIQGKGNRIFDPKANSTRAEVATLLINMIEKYLD